MGVALCGSNGCGMVRYQGQVRADVGVRLDFRLGLYAMPYIGLWRFLSRHGAGADRHFRLCHGVGLVGYQFQHLAGGIAACVEQLVGIIDTSTVP